MIVVVGSPSAAEVDGVAVPAGLPASIAMAAAAAGSSVQLVGKVGDDPAGDAVLLALSRSGVEHAATLRDAANPTPLSARPPADTVAPADAAGEPQPVEPGPVGLTLDPADVDLALRYFTDFGVVVVAAELVEEALRVVAEAASYSGAAFVLVSSAEPPGWLPDSATVLAPPDASDGPFAAVVGEYAAALDRGEPPGAAFRNLVGRLGWQPASTD